MTTLGGEALNIAVWIGKLRDDLAELCHVPVTGELTFRHVNRTRVGHATIRLRCPNLYINYAQHATDPITVWRASFTLKGSAHHDPWLSRPFVGTFEQVSPTEVLIADCVHQGGEPRFFLTIDYDFMPNEERPSLWDRLTHQDEA